jgi:hypothetical protein
MRPGVTALAKGTGDSTQMAQPANLSGPLIDPTKIADAFYYLHAQHPSCWSHEIQLTPFSHKPAY